MGQTIKVSTKAAVVITAFHQDVFNTSLTGQRASETMKKKLSALLVSKYGQPTIGKDANGKETRSGGPSFEAYRADHAALKHLAEVVKKLKDNQYVRKAYAHAVKTLYGAIPESQDAAAVAKRAQRDAKAALAKAAAAAPTGAPAGETQATQPNEDEQIEQVIARLGYFKCMDALIRIAAADEKTKAQAVHFEKMAKKLATLMTATA
jgi:hypothetical protein